MPDTDPSKEERILSIMKRVLTDVAKDTYTRPGYRHPLSDETIRGIQECLVLITAREAELNEDAGRPSKLRPRFKDEPPGPVAVSLDLPDTRDGGDKKDP